ncbi:adenylate kinase [Colletotrichum salicis]|uniref:Adenylate kinase n=1 Tax=Colletotrichum salicis TaxID=1209931 RepID=A0A135T0D3_9PEZI|nr:adenylate kinase [Colletotrichum salicis]
MDTNLAPNRRKFAVIFVLGWSSIGPICGLFKSAFHWYVEASVDELFLSLNVKKENAEARYLARGGDKNDSGDKFTKRFAEYLEEGPSVERHYREAGLLVDIDNNGTKEENIAGVEKELGDNALWNRVVGQATESVFLVSH